MPLIILPQLCKDKIWNTVNRHRAVDDTPSKTSLTAEFGKSKTKS